MIQQWTKALRKAVAGFLTVALVAGATALLTPRRAEAHCDSINGPVVTAARQALETGNVNLVLPYVKSDAEAELTAAFRRAVAVRKLGGQAAQLADQYFFETAVRLHRLGEGAGFTGLRYGVDPDPALEAAEKALATGSTAEVYAVLNQALEQALHERWHAVVEAREKAAREGTVAAHRERVEAELAFEIFAHEIHGALTHFAPHGEAPAAGGDTRGSTQADGAPAAAERDRAHGE